MYCLDTSVIVDYLRGDKKIVNKLNNILDKEIFLTPITLFELYKGAYFSKDADIKSLEVKRFLSFFYVLDFDESISMDYGKEYSRLKNLGKPIPDFDLIIACFARVNDLILITRDKKHFKKIKTKLEIW